MHEHELVRTIVYVAQGVGVVFAVAWSGHRILRELRLLRKSLDAHREAIERHGGRVDAQPPPRRAR